MSSFYLRKTQDMDSGQFIRLTDSWVLLWIRPCVICVKSQGDGGKPERQGSYLFGFWGFEGETKNKTSSLNKYIKRITSWEVVLREEMPGDLFEIGWLGKTSLKRWYLGWDTKDKKNEGLQRIGMKGTGRRSSKAKDPAAGKSLAVSSSCISWV